MKLQNNQQQEDGASFIEGIRMFNKPIVVNSVDVYIDEPIRELSYYRNLLHYMRQMDEHDELRIWIDSDGGYLDSAMAISDAMNNAEGNVTVIVTGHAYSAAGAIALQAPSLMVGDNASFMCHTASYGTNYGKQGDIEGLVHYNKRTVEKLCRETYKYFLTDAEIELMLLGKDYWFDADETKERLEKRQALIKAKAEDALGKQQEIVEEVPKVKRKRKPKVVPDIIAE
jgi:ATP-dependent protease ClpP protease subunit